MALVKAWAKAGVVTGCVASTASELGPVFAAMRARTVPPRGWFAVGPGATPGPGDWWMPSKGSA